MSLTQKTNHVAEAIGNLIGQFQDKPNLEAWLSSYVEEIQELEDVLFDVIGIASVANANDAQLDTIGKIVGEKRQGRTDANFRAAIQSRILLNIGNGTIEDIYAVIVALAGPVVPRLVPYYPAAFITQITVPINPAVIDPLVVARLAKSATAAGVNGITTFGVTGSFQYDGPAGTGFDDGLYGGAL